jgi:hypothetical protein
MCSGSICPSHQCMLSPMHVTGHNRFLPDHPVRDRPRSGRMAEAIGTNHGVLNRSAIDASGCRTHAACFLFQFIQGFSDKQSSTALISQTSSRARTVASMKIPGNSLKLKSDALLLRLATERLIAPLTCNDAITSGCRSVTMGC